MTASRISEALVRILREEKPCPLIVRSPLLLLFHPHASLMLARARDVQVWPGGFVALSTDFTLHVWDQTRPSGDRLYRIPVRLSGERPMTAMSLLQPYYDSEDGASRLGSGRLQVLLATSDNSVVVSPWDSQAEGTQRAAS